MARARPRLLKLLTGELAPQTGNVKLGQGLRWRSWTRTAANCIPNNPWPAVTDGSGDTVMVAGKPRHVMSYMQDFLFTPQQARTPVKVLSGGERARLLLAKLFATPSNFLVLDEPTNDLDLETLDLLEEVIADYPGTALLVSHDRDFLDRVATRSCWRKAMAASPNMPAAIPTCWRSERQDWRRSADAPQLAKPAAKAPVRSGPRARPR